MRHYVINIVKISLLYHGRGASSASGILMSDSNRLIYESNDYLSTAFGFPTILVSVL